jgi:predicted dehydrogenase
MNFAIIGDGRIAQRHKEAIKHVGGTIKWIHDPAKYDQGLISMHDNIVCFGGALEACSDMFEAEIRPHSNNQIDYIVICSPTYLHRYHTQLALNAGYKVICEKPLCLPWEPIIEDDRINIVLQLRYIENLPKKADLIRAVMVRDEEFFKSWKGDPRLAGGNLYEFFIHYIDLAIQLGADFEGQVLPSGKQIREIKYKVLEPDERAVFISDYDKMVLKTDTSDLRWLRRDNQKCGDWYVRYPGEYSETLDIMKLDMQSLYNKMYDEILAGRGIKPKDLFYLTWILNKNSEAYGYRQGGINKPIVIKKELL